MRLPSRIAALLAATALVTTSAFAGTKDPTHASIAGTAIGPEGKPLGGIEIRAMQLDDPKKPVTIAETNSKGLYMLKSLPVGTYSLTAYLDGFAYSRAIIKTRGVAWAKVDFDLTKDAGDAAGSRVETYIRSINVVNGNMH
jgi:hypothetical protein